MIEPPFEMFEGLSLSADLIDIDYTNRIFEGLDAQYIIDFLPERVTRGAGLPGDPPGLPGRITRLDVRGFNIGQVKIRSVDYQIRYTRTTSIGTFDFRGAATSYDTYESRNTPLSPTVSTSYRLPRSLYLAVVLEQRSDWAGPERLLSGPPVHGCDAHSATLGQCAGVEWPVCL